jgi:hypothetical protein
MNEAKTIRMASIRVEPETMAMIQNNNLSLEDLANAICLQFRKFHLCQRPCVLATLVSQCVIQEREKFSA